MSYLSIRGVKLDIVHTRQIHREVLTSRDGMAYHGTRWTFDCDCVFNPFATAYAQPGAGVSLFGGLLVAMNNSTATQANPNAFPVPVRPVARGTLPVFTDATLRHWLSQPRGQLIYGVGGIVLLACPAPGYSCDMTGTGPNVVVNDVTCLFENKTFQVSLKITCVVNEARQSVIGVKAAGPILGFPLLLSNRWRQYVDQDDDHFVTLVTQGEATFRLDELAKRGTRVDQYRNAVAPNCPPNFHRGPLRWLAVEDGAKLLYEVTDRELAFNTPTRFGCTRIEVYETRQMVQPNVRDALAIGLSFTLPSNAGHSGTSHAGGPGVEDRHRRSWGSIAHAGASTAISIGRAVFPVVTRTALARVWGNRNSSRKTLGETLAVGACLARIGPPNSNVFTGYSSQARMTAEASGKFCEFELVHTQVWVPFNLFGANDPMAVDGTTPDSPLAAVTRLRQNDDTSGFLQRATASNLTPPNSPTPANSGTRGTWTGMLMTQTIPPAEGLPTPPPTEVDVVDLLP